MDTKLIRNALKAKIAAGMPSVVRAQPNVNSGPGDLPRLEISTAAADQVGGSLKGDVFKTEEGRLAVIVCTRLGEGEDEALDLSAAISDLFPEGSKVNYTGGVITIMAPAEIRGGLPSDDCYRIPVIVRYRAADTGT